MASQNIFDLLSKFGPLYNKQTKEQIGVKELNCKFFGILFTAQWCKGCVQLSKILPTLIKRIDSSGEEFKLITIRMDNSSSKFAQNYYYFPGLLQQQAQTLNNYFKIRALPSMLVFNIKGKLVSLTGVEDMQRFREHTLKFWGSI